MAKKTATRKKTNKKSFVTRKSAGKKKKSATAAKRKQKTAKKPRKKKPSARSKIVKKKTAKPASKKKGSARKIKPKTLGRPRINGEARADQLFQKDYQAREIFEFLGVTTLKELETYGPDEIIEKLTGPMVQTVQRIRKTLAMVNRSLADDRQFALEFKERLP